MEKEGSCLLVQILSTSSSMEVGLNKDIEVGVKVKTVSPTCYHRNQ